jgi:hypothetical protein
MFFVDCVTCDESYFGTPTHARSTGWVIGDDDYCPKCAVEVEKKANAVEAEIVGFDRPEDGSQDRYKADRKVQPWAKHKFWWLVHNAVAHPLIAVAPVKPFFSFHDWTSRKMHGE